MVLLPERMRILDCRTSRAVLRPPCTVSQGGAGALTPSPKMTMTCLREGPLIVKGAFAGFFFFDFEEPEAPEGEGFASTIFAMEAAGRSGRAFARMAADSALERLAALRATTTKVCRALGFVAPARGPAGRPPPEGGRWNGTVGQAGWAWTGVDPAIGREGRSSGPLVGLGGAAGALAFFFFFFFFFEIIFYILGHKDSPVAS